MKTRRRVCTVLKGLTLAVAVSLAPETALWAEPVTTAPPPPPAMAAAQSAYGRLPLSFEANHGQADPQVQFLTHGRGHTLFLTPSAAVLALRTGEAKAEAGAGDAAQRTPSPRVPALSQSVVRMTFPGANVQTDMVGLNPLPGIVNYMIGGDPSTWRTHIPTYEKIEYQHVYPGVDLVYYGHQGQLEYDFIVAPGADPTQITLAFEGVETLDVDAQGDLVLTVPRSSTDASLPSATTLRLHKPVVYQRDEHGDKHLLAGTYVLLAAETAPLRFAAAVLDPNETPPPASRTPHVAFQVAAYDRSQPLIIDPVLSWATYLGGSGADNGYGIAVDQAGNAYVTGHTVTPGSDFPGTAGSLIQSTNAGSYDAFVTKLNAAGTALLYSTYLGGSGDDDGFGIAVDQAGQAYVTGGTTTPGSGFPGTAGSHIQSTYGGGISDAFVTKLNAAGTALLYSTYLGGSGDNEGLGRNGGDYGLGIAVDQAGNAYVTGKTSSPPEAPPGSGFPGTAGSLIQSTFGGHDDAFVTKINAAGTALVYSTYLGDVFFDSGVGIAVDQAGNAYVTGYTDSFNFPGTAGSLIQSTKLFADRDAFVTKLNAAGTALLYST